MHPVDFEPARRLALAVLLAGAVLAGPTGCSRPAPVIQDARHLVGAHYYTWFPGNFSKGTLRSALLPQQLPALGLYRSDDAAVIEQHIAWYSRYGIDFLTLDWWPNKAEWNERFMASFLGARNLADIQFCIFYETWVLGFDPVTGATRIDETSAAHLTADLEALADRYFDHPSYLRVGGRPVVILYLSRTLTGDYAKALARARRALRRRGHNVFLIGDEVFWEVSPDGSKDQHAPAAWPLTPVPQPGRIRCFDAITAYNMYEAAKPLHRGYGADSAFVPDVAAKYAEYVAAAGEGVYFVPGILPGYNDRGVRLGQDHHPIPRQWTAGAREGSFLAEMFDRIGFPYSDPRLNMILITSWNEWNEDTAIEPLAPSPATARDAGKGGLAFTHGFSYSGYGTRYLEVVQQKTVAVSGRVLSERGTPLSGVVIDAQQGDTALDARTDTAGYYRLSRLRLRPGACEVRVRGRAGSTRITVHKGFTTTNVNFTLGPRGRDGITE